MKEPKDIRDAVFDTIYEIAREDKNFIFIADDMDAFSLKRYKKDFPKQYINIGVAEQNMIDLAAGLAVSGKTVCCFGIASYVTARCYEQIKFSISSMSLPVMIVGIGAGFSFNFDGPSHQGTIDLGIMRLLPEMTIFNPSDDKSATEAVKISYKLKKPTYIRLDKGVLPRIYSEKEAKKGYRIIKKLSKLNIITTGIITSTVLKALDELKLNNIGLVDLYQIKPLPKYFVRNVLKPSSKILTIEEHSILGGLSTIISEQITQNNLRNIYFKSLGIKDHQFDVFGSREWLLGLNGLDVKNIKKIITQVNEV